MSAELALAPVAAGAALAVGLDVVARIGKLVGLDPTNVRNVGGFLSLIVLLAAHAVACGQVAISSSEPASVRLVAVAVLPAGAFAGLFAFFGLRALLTPLPDVEQCSPAHPSRFDAPMFWKSTWDLQPEEMDVLPTDFPNVREATTDGALVPVDLASLYKDRPLVLEMGSISCPIFCLRIAPMEKLAAEFGDRVNFAVLYGGEAHPTGGADDTGLIPADPAPEVRAKRVERLRSELGLKRRVLVDGADGAMQGRFGFMPNGVAVVDKTGKVTFWSRWNFPVETHLAIRHVLGEAGPDEPAPKPSAPGAADMEGLGPLNVMGLLYKISGLVGLADLLMSLLHSAIGGTLQRAGLPISLFTSDALETKICSTARRHAHV
jgi:hypothetical protein